MQLISLMLKALTLQDKHSEVGAKLKENKSKKTLVYPSS